MCKKKKGNKTGFPYGHKLLFVKSWLPSSVDAAQPFIKFLNKLKEPVKGKALPKYLKTSEKSK